MGPIPGSGGLAARGVALLLATALLAGCVDFFLAPEPADDPVAIFDQFWGEYDAYYASFTRKGIDWDSVYDTYRPLVNDGVTGRDLVDVLGQVVQSLEDGHADLYTPYGYRGYTVWYDTYPENFERDLLSQYVTVEPALAPGSGARPGLVDALGLGYGWLGSRIGYLRIPTFGNPALRDGIDDAIAALDGIDALVIDIRSNGGGSNLNTDAVAARLTDRRYLYRHHVYRNGPGHDDFTRVYDDYIEPFGEHRFLGPVAVLTNRRVFSASEGFLMAMQARGDVILVGDTTGGGTGNPVWRELPNGWTFRVPRWISWSAAGDTVDGVGIAPDYPVSFGDVSGRDPILEAAIAELDRLLAP